MKKKNIEKNKDSAIEYAGRGWAVFPLVASEKVPYAGSSGFKEATTDRQQIDEAWNAHPNSNIAIATGRVSDLVVVDIDIKHGAKGEESALALDLPETLEASTPSGGRHLYYRYPRSGIDVERKINWRPGIDLLGDRGYVVAAPSVTADGSYEWVNDRTCAPLPEAFLAPLATTTDDQVLWLSVEIPQGQRNDRLFKYGCSLRAQGENETTLLQALRDLNLRRCSPPLQDAEVARIAKNAASRDVDDRRQEKSVASLIGKFLDGLDCELFHTPDRQPFISFERHGHQETWALRHNQFRDWLCAEMFLRYNKSPSTSALEEALATASGLALFRGEEREVHLRVARHNGDYYVDLCNESWQAVRVTEGNWEIVDAPPVRFRRTNTMRALPIPAGGGDINALLEVINVRAEDLPLVVAFILEAYRPDTPYPILELTGVQGSAKSTTQDRIRQLIDPNACNLRTEPKNDQDLAVAATNNHVVSYNNLSNLPKPRQDVLCSMSTGAGFAARKLFSDSDEIVFNIKRPIMINGINSLVTNQDLVDRVISLELPEIDSTRVRGEQDLETDFQLVSPALFGALLDVFAATLKQLPRVRPETLPRLADFCRLGIALSEVTGWEPFVNIFERKHQQMELDVLESCPVALAVIAFIDEKTHFEGTFQYLLAQLSIYKSFDEAWPKSPRGLSSALLRNLGALKTVGISVQRLGRSREGRKIRITKVSSDRSSQQSQRSRSKPVA